MKCYAVIDTNVLVSALLRWDSVPGQVVQQTYAHEIIPVFNDSILQEYEEVLSRKKFHFPKHPKVVTPAEMLRILDNL